MNSNTRQAIIFKETMTPQYFKTFFQLRDEYIVLKNTLHFIIGLSGESCTLFQWYAIHFFDSFANSFIYAFHLFVSINLQSLYEVFPSIFSSSEDPIKKKWNFEKVRKFLPSVMSSKTFLSISRISLIRKSIISVREKAL